jgi:chromosome segregation ATPase
MRKLDDVNGLQETAFDLGQQLEETGAEVEETKKEMEDKERDLKSAKRKLVEVTAERDKAAIQEEKTKETIKRIRKEKKNEHNLFGEFQDQADDEFMVTEGLGQTPSLT